MDEVALAQESKKLDELEQEYLDAVRDFQTARWKLRNVLKRYKIAAKDYTITKERLKEKGVEV